jgi:hypothetical protein
MPRSSPAPKHRRMMDELRKHTTAQFDREHMGQQVNDHKAAASKQPAEESSGSTQR